MLSSIRTASRNYDTRQVLTPHGGTNLILVLGQIFQMELKVSQQFISYSLWCACCIFDVRMYLNWGKTLKETRWNCIRRLHHCIELRRHVFVMICVALLFQIWVCVCILISTAFHLAYYGLDCRLDWELSGTTRTPFTARQCYWSQTFQAHSRIVHVTDCECTPQLRPESFKTYNFNLICPKKGKNGKRIPNEYRNHTYTSHSMHISTKTATKSYNSTFPTYTFKRTLVWDYVGSYS